MDFNLKRSRAVFDNNNVPITADSTVQAALSAVNAGGNPLVADANQVLEFHVVDDAVSSRCPPFHPLMSHQIYGEGEEIKGYVEPKVVVTLSGMFLPLIEVSYKSKVLSDEQATALLAPVEKAFKGDDGEGDNVVMVGPAGREAFAAAVREEAGALEAGGDGLGEAVLRRAVTSSSTRTTGDATDDKESEQLTIYRSTLADASEVVKKLHRRMEPLLLFFIDAASAIDGEDPCWEFLLCTLTGADGKVRVVGLATVYSFYVYPDQRRFRLSQAFVMPAEQGKGIGSAIVDAVFSVAKERNVVDITLEDPTDDFRRLRDRKDLREMMGTAWVMEAAEAAISEAVAAVSEATKSGTFEATATATATAVAAALDPKADFLKRLGAALMMNTKQSERMWESLLYKLAVDTALDASNEDDGRLATVVEGWMAKNIEATFVGKDGETKAKEVAAGKVISDTPTGFWMYKDLRKAKKDLANPLNTSAPPANVANMVPVNDVTDESQANAIAEYVATRINEVRVLLGVVGR